MAITFPYTINFGAYGTLSSVYSWYVMYYQYPTNTSTITSNATATLKTPIISGDTCILPITISNSDVINRTGTSGYTAPNFTYTSTPTFKLNNVTLGSSIQLYSASNTTILGAKGDGTTSTFTLATTQTINVNMPVAWLDDTLTVSVSDVVTIVTTSVTQTNAKTSASFTLPISQQTISFTVNWTDDSLNAYNTRPNSDEYVIYKNGSVFKNISITGSNTATWISSYNAFLFNTDVITITSTSNLLNYTNTLTVNGYVASMTHQLQTVSHSSNTITWVDDSNIYGYRPASFYVQLYRNYKVFLEEETTTGLHNWTLLPKKDINGVDYKYFFTYNIGDKYRVKDLQYAVLCGKLHFEDTIYSNLKLNDNNFDIYLGGTIINTTTDWMMVKDGIIKYYKDYKWDDAQPWNDDYTYTEFNFTPSVL